MKKSFLIAISSSLAAAALMLAFVVNPVQAQVAQNSEDLKSAPQTPDSPAVPPELQGLVSQFVTAFVKGDEVAMEACWGAPQTVGTTARRDIPRGTVTPVATSNEASGNREMVMRLRTLCGRLFGAPELLKLLRVDFGGAGQQPIGQDNYHDVQIHLMASDLHIVLSVDDVEKVGGAWKFKGRMKGELTIVVPTAG